MLFSKSLVLGLSLLPTIFSAPVADVELKYETIATVGTFVVEIPTAVIISGALIPTTGSATTTTITTTTSNAVLDTIYSGIATAEEVKNKVCGALGTEIQYVAAISKDLVTSLTDGVGIYLDFCGNSLSVSYQDITVTVTVVDFCDECVFNAISLGPEGFAALTSKDLSEIEIEISWRLA